jgi:serine/threonine protein kinase
VKPSNVLLDGNMVAKLSDFGISRIAPETATELATKPAGTVGYGITYLIPLDFSLFPKNYPRFSCYYQQNYLGQPPAIVCDV